MKSSSLRIVVAISPQSLISVVQWGGESEWVRRWRAQTQKLWSCEGGDTIGLLWCDLSTVAPLPRRHSFCSVSRWAGGCVHIKDTRGGGFPFVFLFFFLKEGVRDGWGRATVVDGCRSTQFNKEHSKVRKRRRAGRASLPSVVLDHVSQLDDELSLFVLLTALKRVLLEKKMEKEENFLLQIQLFPASIWLIFWENKNRTVTKYFWHKADVIEHVSHFAKNDKKCALRVNTHSLCHSSVGKTTTQSVLVWSPPASQSTLLNWIARHRLSPHVN